MRQNEIQAPEKGWFSGKANLQPNQRFAPIPIRDSNNRTTRHLSIKKIAGICFSIHLTFIFVVLMKLLACILSIYILVLTAMPCCDKPDSGSVQKTEIARQTRDVPQQEIDHCSPFCSCNCCSSPKLQIEQAVSYFVAPMLHEYLAELTPKFFSSVVSSIWQPPRSN